MKRPPLPQMIWGFHDEQAPCTWCGKPTKEFRRTRGVEINRCCSDACAKKEAWLCRTLGLQQREEAMA